MAIEAEGKFIKCLPEVTGEGKNGTWRKCDFVIETFGDYPKNICFSAWGDKVDQVQSLVVGEILKVKFDPESREYNERWYTDLRAYKIYGNGDKQAVQAPKTEPKPATVLAEAKDDLPF